MNCIQQPSGRAAELFIQLLLHICNGWVMHLSRVAARITPSTKTHLPDEAGFLPVKCADGNTLELNLAAACFKCMGQTPSSGLTRALHLVRKLLSVLTVCCGLHPQRPETQRGHLCTDTQQVHATEVGRCGPSLSCAHQWSSTSFQGRTASSTYLFSCP